MKIKLEVWVNVVAQVGEWTNYQDAVEKVIKDHIERIGWVENVEGVQATFASKIKNTLQFDK
jgi:hypothetical protein